MQLSAAFGALRSADKGHSYMYQATNDLKERRQNDKPWRSEQDNVWNVGFNCADSARQRGSHDSLPLLLYRTPGKLRGSPYHGTARGVSAAPGRRGRRADQFPSSFALSFSRRSTFRANYTHARLL